ncbi:UDP-N-acetylmuramoyl-tripeptide--D-alanyl-D-alanine ligase [Sphingorhabdus sp. Alg239-R122]|uniref:UDP-N-acetylmuramoyl-tripeptide--D-alanyl-D- alanine ligase n=1 Tax=Sphingorhabdus sp. Alg239-R122 TaxID=2305989 RepID=UPI0013DBBB94|nr:UDP-N-acetylmuramoyl-tripeptide--D-alanyl-D-alanine ligase [Sphingorhabdus sp. Alg239-R122]
MTLWKSSDIEKAINGKASMDFDVTGVEFDSREVSEGDLFLALKGEQSDGHLYLDKAFENGANGAVSEQDCVHPHIRVADSTKALDDLAKAARTRVNAKIIGVTGSAGKTGTKEALFAALNRSSHGKAHRSVKSYNNHVGVPLSLSRMPADTSFGIFEMGMNHKGELSQLTKLVRPHVAIVTTIAPAHIGHFSGEEEIADAKAEIFEGFEEGGTAIIPHDSPHYERLRKAAEKHAGEVVTFGLHADADARAIDMVPAIGGGTLVTAKIRNANLCYTVAEAGEHWVLNSLAVLAAVQAVGGDMAAAGLALAELPGMAGRGARHKIAIEGGTALVIDESYNANPASMGVTIAALGAEAADRRIVLLGAMKELGAASDTYHAELAVPLRAAQVDLAILVGDEMKILADTIAADPDHATKAVHVADALEAEKLLKTQLCAGDALLVKGSNAMGLAAVVGSLTDAGLKRAG